MFLTESVQCDKIEQISENKGFIITVSSLSSQLTLRNYNVLEFF